MISDIPFKPCFKGIQGNWNIGYIDNCLFQIRNIDLGVDGWLSGSGRICGGLQNNRIVFGHSLGYLNSKEIEIKRPIKRPRNERPRAVDYYYVNAKVQAEILAIIENDEQSPAILFNEFENGKVLYFSFNNLWKWQLRNSDYSDFMTNIILWLSASNTERFVSFTDKNSYFEGEKIKITLTAFDAKLAPIKNLATKLIIKQNEKKVFEEYLLEKGNEYLAEIENLEKGKYNYTVFAEKTGQQTSGNFLVTDDNPEARDRGFNQPLLAFISKQTNGKIINMETLSDFTFPKAISKTEELKTELPIYRKWYLIAIFLVCFCTELFLRKRWGLL